MAVNRVPVLKRCRSLGMDPVYLGIDKKSNRQLKRANRKMSEYGLQLREKQKAKFIYGVLEKPFLNYFKKASKMNGMTGENLMVLLESRLDNVVFRLGLARTRREARQIVDHKHVLVNGKQINIPSYLVKAGDVVEIAEPIFNSRTHIPLAGPANKQGRIAADNIAGIESVYKGTYGASVVKVGKYAAASVGMTEKRLKADGKKYRKIYIHPSSSASYYPGASRMDIKLIFGDDGTIYGAQIIGEKGVDKRIDAIAQAMYAGFKADALGELELAYAPPFSSAKDPVNYAGFVASNVLTGKSTPVYAENIPDGAVVLDVREPSEVANGKIPNSVNIPLGQLRGRLSEIDKSRLVVASCQVGLRGYLAERILKQNGFNAANLSGGYLTWKAVNSK